MRVDLGAGLLRRSEWWLFSCSPLGPPPGDDCGAVVPSDTTLTNRVAPPCLAPINLLGLKATSHFQASRCEVVG